MPAAFVKAAIPVLARGGVPLGFSVAEQDQAAHVAISFSVCAASVENVASLGFRAPV
ncbi:Uncharacterised protein [Mycobacterium tuberculosis]|nr:Uncharacterised protein [Mycobacterium tuberculosis]